MKFTPALALITLALPTQAALVWTGAGDAISLYQEANWLDDNGMVPAANTINPTTAVTAVTGGLIEINAGTGTPSAFGGNFTLGANDLSVGGMKTLQSTGGSGINGTVGQALGISGGSLVNVQFITNLTITLSGSSTLQYRGGGNPINNSTIHLSDDTSCIIFTAETYAAFEAEHESKVSTLYGPGELGVTPDVYEPGDTLILSMNGAGNTVVKAIPEPSSLILSLASLGFLARRKR